MSLENIQRTVCGALTDAGQAYPSFSGLQYATRLLVADNTVMVVFPFKDRSSITGKPGDCTHTIFKNIR